MKIPENVPWQSTGITLGRGGQGQVQLVRARNQPEGRKYALKILSNTGSRQARARFRREIEVVKGLNSPFIVQTFGHSSEDDDFQYYVMEYHENAKTLGSIIFSGDNPFYGDVTKCLQLFEDIVSAIEVCESASPQVVHRDINPKNILVLPDDSIRLIDFGICQVSDGTMITLVDENVGARNFTSPECEAGNDESVGAQSDLYSAAKVLWAAITSMQAFAREEAVFKNRSMDAIFPKQTDTWHLNDIFEKSIREDPRDRCRTAAEMLALVRDVRYLVLGGFPPLLMVRAYCPSCGRRSIREYDEGYRVFGNPNPPGVASLICDLCGYCFVRQTNVWQSTVDRFRSLR